MSLGQHKASLRMAPSMAVWSELAASGNSRTVRLGVPFELVSGTYDSTLDQACILLLARRALPAWTMMLQLNRYLIIFTYAPVGVGIGNLLVLLFHGVAWYLSNSIDMELVGGGGGSLSNRCSKRASLGFLYLHKFVISVLAQVLCFLYIFCAFWLLLS